MPCPLVIIPARGGSKGIPGKNIKPLAGRPLLDYTLDVALDVAPTPRHILLSTDAEEIAACARQRIPVPFMRPAELAADNTPTRPVLLHALDYADAHGIPYDSVLLLQPTSPLRTADDVRAALALYTPAVDMVVSVTRSQANPYYNLFECDARGYLHISKGDGRLTRRQDAPPVWEYNGAIYIINPASLRRYELGDMPRRIPYEMPAARSLDLDTPQQWAVAELLMQHGYL